jgi:hypothetical protein
MLRFAASVLLLACLAPPAYCSDARDSSDSSNKPTDAKPVKDAVACKAVCGAARHDCRSKVQQATDADISPVLSMNRNGNPNAAAAKEVRPQSQQLRPTEAQAFRARRAERLQTCELQYRSCALACG